MNDAAAKLKLTADMQEAVNTAFATRRPIVVAHVADNAPHLSYRGSTQAYSDTQLAIWVRNPKGGILDAIEENPAVALLFGYFEPDDRGFMIFRGRARRDDSDAVRNQDAEQKGVAVIIDLDSVDGFFGGEGIRMRR